MQKKVTAFTLAVVLILSLTVSALAATPRWDTTSDVDIIFSFSGSTANCTVYIDGKAGTNKIVAEVKLQKYVSGSYTTITTWGGTSYSNQYTLDDAVSNCAKGTYRLYITATVSNANGASDKITEYATATY